MSDSRKAEREAERAAWTDGDGKNPDMNGKAGGRTTTTTNGVAAVAPRGKPVVPHMSITCLNDVTPEKLKWLWWGVIPQGKITLLTGDPGLGKSFLTLDVASRVSRGDRWPNDVLKTECGAVILFAAEDDIADTIRPRLDAANANVNNVYAINGVNRTDIKSGKMTTWSFQLDRDMPILVAELERLKAAGVTVRLIVIDPISCYMGKSDSHNNAEVRGTLAPLAELASTYKVAVLLISHLNKSGTGKAVYRTSGSLAFAAAARSVWVVVRDLDDPKRRMMLPVKMNLCEEPHGLAYSIENGVVRWEADPVEMTGDEFLAKESERLRKPQQTEENSELARAADWLKTELAKGAVLSTVLKKDAKENGITEATLRRAFKTLDGKATKDGDTGKWSWTLPSQGVQESLPDNVERLEHVEQLASIEDVQGAQDAQDNQAGDVEHVADESTETEDATWI